MHVQEENGKEFNFKGFSAYLRTPAGGKRNKATAKSITSDVIMFFNTTSQSSSDTSNNIDSLFEKTNLKSFLHHSKTKKNYKPTTLTEKIRRLKLAIEYTMQLNKDKDHYTSRGNYLLKILTEWCHSLSQDVTKQRKETSKYVAGTQQNEHPSDAMVCTVSMPHINAAI